jgi:hypothetical protein
MFASLSHWKEYEGEYYSLNFRDGRRSLRSRYAVIFLRTSEAQKSLVLLGFLQVRARQHACLSICCTRRASIRAAFHYQNACISIGSAVSLEYRSCARCKPFPNSALLFEHCTSSVSRAS